MLFQIASRVLLSPQVLEKSPGRLRLRYALLTRLDASRMADIQRVADMLSAPKAIRSVDFDAATGQVNVDFEPNHAADEILRYLGDMLAFLGSVKSQLQAIPPQHIAACHPSFVRLVTERLGDSLNLRLAERELRTAIRSCRMGRKNASG